MSTVLQKMYSDKRLYSSEDMFSPPAERLPHVIRFELTQGCEWRKCTYCCGYDRIKNQEKSIEEYVSHVNTVFDRLQAQNYRNLTRVFIGGGNALAVNTQKLLMAIGYTGLRFRQCTGKFPKRTSVYGRTKSIKEKGREQLQFLHHGLNKKGGIDDGLDLIYWGVETGSTAVMEYVQKSSTQDDVLEAAEALKGTGIKTSVMIMPGLGGIRFYDEHVEQTARILREIKPAYVTFMGVNPRSDSRYSKIMQQELLDDSNRPLSDSELATQLADIIEMMFSESWWDVKLGCYLPTIDAVGRNPVAFGSIDIKEDRQFIRTSGVDDISLLVRDIRRQADRIKKIEDTPLNSVIPFNNVLNGVKEIILSERYFRNYLYRSLVYSERINLRLYRTLAIKGLFV